MGAVRRLAITRLWVGLLGVALGVGLLAVVAAPRPADGATASTSSPAVELRINAQAYEGPRGTILADLRGRCAPGYVFADLVLDFSQGDVTTPSVSGSPFPCDGRWHGQRVMSLEAFEPGPATLTARLSVVDAETGDPGPQVVVTQAIYVRPAAKIELPRTAELRPHAVVKMVVRARCDAPWVLQDFYISATQGTYPDVAFDDALLDLTCDGVTRSVTVLLQSTTGVAFHRGALLVDADITLLDPEQFDPVTQVRASRTVTVR